MNTNRRTISAFGSSLVALFIAVSATAQTTVAEPSDKRVPPLDCCGQGIDPNRRDAAYADSESEPASSPRRGPYRRPFLMALAFLPLATFVDAAGSQPSDVLYPRDRFAI